MNRRDILKLTTAGMASVALPGWALEARTQSPRLPLLAVFEKSRAEGHHFASTLLEFGIEARGIERDISGLWYESLREELRIPHIIVGLTFEPEAHYLSAFARESLHRQVIRLDIRNPSLCPEIDAINLETGKAFTDLLPCRATTDWPAMMAEKLVQNFGYQRVSKPSKINTHLPGAEARMSAWAITPIPRKQEQPA